jgi:hypothetical protein
MSKKSGWLKAGLTVAAFSAVASFALGASSAEAAVVFCKTAGVPQGCVVRPTVAPVVVRPAPVVALGVSHVGYTRVTPVAVRHVGYTRVTPYGVRHVGYTRVRR